MSTLTSSSKEDPGRGRAGLWAIVLLLTVTSLFVPIALLGRAFPWLPTKALVAIGGIAFACMPLIVALGSSWRLTKSAAVATGAGIGLIAILVVGGAAARLLYSDVRLRSVLGLPILDVGTLAGIVAGVLSAICERRQWTAGATRSKVQAIVLTIIASVVVGCVFGAAWPVLGRGVQSASLSVIKGSPTSAAAVDGFVGRLVSPLGSLLHEWNAPLHFEMGSYETQDGRLVHGDIPRYLAGDPSAGIVGGGYLFKMWGLPAAALAMWYAWRRQSRWVSVLLAAAFTCFLTGITEPIEVVLLLMAPGMFAIHALLAAAAQAMFVVLGGRFGVLISQGLLDFVVLHGSGTRAWLIWVLGPMWAIVYFGVFAKWARTRDDA
jgi:PTS system glucose-specific IIC component